MSILDLCAAGPTQDGSIYKELVECAFGEDENIYFLGITFSDEEISRAQSKLKSNSELFLQYRVLTKRPSGRSATVPSLW